MRVLLCSYFSFYGGMERRLEEEAAILSGLGHEVLYATARFPGSEHWDARMTAAGARAVAWRPYKFIERRQFWPPFEWAATASAGTIKRLGLDLAHVAVPYGYVGMTMAYVLRRAGVAHVLAVHTKPTDRPLEAQGARAIRTALAGMAGMYAVSSPALQGFRDLYAGLLPPDRPMQVVHNGVAPTVFRRDPAARRDVRSELAVGPHDPVVIVCGRLDSQKRPQVALRAFARLVTRMQAARLLVVGDGPARSELETESVRLGLRQAVRFVGWVSDPARYYAASDCYLSTSNNQEGFSLSAAEALSTGLVAVMSANDAFASIYGAVASARLVNAEDDSRVADALFDLLSLSAQARDELGAAGRAYIEAHLSTASMRHALEAFYADVTRRMS